MKFRKKPVAVEAEQWHKHGDHPAVSYFHREGYVSNQKCNDCFAIMSDHGWIDARDCGEAVCPSDWIVYDEYGDAHAWSNEAFLDKHEPI